VIELDSPIIYFYSTMEAHPVNLITEMMASCTA